MFAGDCHPEGLLLRGVYDTETFANYCRQRGISFVSPSSGSLHAEGVRRWEEALARLPPRRRADVELEMARVNEMTTRAANAHLVEASAAGELPPDDVPAGAALALWFLLHRPETFREAFLNHEFEEGQSWRHARMARGLALADLPGKSLALADTLKEFFRLREGTGRFCVVESHPLDRGACFVAHVADRTHVLDGFTDSGERASQRWLPAFAVGFACYPRDGVLLLHSRLRANDRVLELARRFGRAVLGADPGEGCLTPQPFDLDRLKEDFRPLPDAPDMEAVRVKTLHLRYPARWGRRQIKLQTLAGDTQSAIQEMIRAHVPAGLLSQLHVCYAELQVRLKDGGHSRNHSIRLWPDRSNLTQGPLGRRIHDCLSYWGLCDAREP